LLKNLSKNRKKKQLSAFNGGPSLALRVLAAARTRSHGKPARYAERSWQETCGRFGNTSKVATQTGCMSSKMLCRKNGKHGDGTGAGARAREKKGKKLPRPNISRGELSVSFRGLVSPKQETQDLPKNLPNFMTKLRSGLLVPFTLVGYLDIGDEILPQFRYEWIFFLI